MKKNKTPELKVVAIGKPNIEALTKEEQKCFYTTLLNRIIELKNETDEAKSKTQENIEENK